MKKVNPILWFVTLPQLLLTCALFASYINNAHKGVLYMLIICSVVTAVSAVYVISRIRIPDKALMLSLTVLSCLVLSASVLFLENTTPLAGLLTPRLTSLLLWGITALYAVFALVKALSPNTNTIGYIQSVIALPIAWFIMFNIITGVQLTTLAVILIVSGALAAVFLIIRIASSHGLKALAASGVKKTGLRIPFLICSIALPIIGLTLNAGIDNLFGDFSSPWFFIIPILNGILLMLPPLADKSLGLLRFFLLSAALSYFIYFFIVFIPYMPLGIFGLIYLLGILIFAPSGALFMQIVELNHERKRLLPLWGGKRLTITLISALPLIPLCLLTGIIGDRQNFENAVSYLEASEAVSDNKINIVRLERTLDNASAALEINRDAFFDFDTVDNTPFLSSAYSALVLNGKVMKNSDINKLRRLFFDKPNTAEANQDITAGLTVNETNITDVSLTEVTIDTVYDTEIGADRTWINLTLKGNGGENSEYVTLFTLPEGAYISDYYLDVGKERKYGILADERAAMSVYKNIVRVKQDPGIIRYVNDRQLELRVFPFPFAGSNIRKTGFEILHSQNFEFTLDGEVITVNSKKPSEKVEFKGGILLSGALKKTLPEAENREKSYYFIADSSENSLINHQISLIEDFASINNINKAQVIFASYYLTEVPLKDIRTVSIIPRHGFNLALAVKKILLENGNDTVPVIIFTSSNPADAILPEHSSWLAKNFPESQYYYKLNDDLRLTPYDFKNNRINPPVTEPILIPLRSFEGVYVRDDYDSEIIPLTGWEEYTASGNQYMDALSLDTALQSNSSMDTRTSLTMLRAGFRAHVLTSQTAFIVVETPEQEAEIWEAQELLLQQDDTIARETLEEPPLLLMTAAFAVLICITFLRRKRKL